MGEDNKPGDSSIKLSRVLDIKPRLGPIPGDQVLPWIGILFIVYIVGKGFLGFTWLQVAFVALWGISTYWVFVGEKSSQMLSRFITPPRWTSGRPSYRNPLSFAPFHSPKGGRNAKKGR